MSSPPRVGVSPPVMSRHLRVLRDARPGRGGAPAVRRARPHHLVAAAADGRVEGVVGRRRGRVERAAGGVQGPRGARVTGSRVLVALRVARAAGADLRRVHRRDRRVVAARTGCSGSPIAPTVAWRSSPSRRSVWSRSAPTASGSRSAHVRVWDPPRRLVFGWRQASFADGPVDRGGGALRARRHRHPRDGRALRLGLASRRSTRPATASRWTRSSTATRNGGRSCSGAGWATTSPPELGAASTP